MSIGNQTISEHFLQHFAIMSSSFTTDTIILILQHYQLNSATVNVILHRLTHSQYTYLYIWVVCVTVFFTLCIPLYVHNHWIRKTCQLSVASKLSILFILVLVKEMSPNLIMEYTSVIWDCCNFATATEKNTIQILS